MNIEHGDCKNPTRQRQLLNQRGLHFGLMAPRYLAWGRGSFGSKSALDIILWGNTQYDMMKGVLERSSRANTAQHLGLVVHSTCIYSSAQLELRVNYCSAEHSSTFTAHDQCSSTLRAHDKYNKVFFRVPGFWFYEFPQRLLHLYLNDDVSKISKFWLSLQSDFQT